MKPLVIDIDAIRKQHREAAEHAAMLEAGISPVRAYRSQAVVDLVAEWHSGRLSRAGFIRCCRNLAVLNPALRI